MVLFTCMPARTPQCVQCLMYGSLYWEEKVNCFSVCPFERPPEAVQDIKSRHVRSHYASSSLIKLSSPATHTGAQDGLRHSNICWLQEGTIMISWWWTAPFCCLVLCLLCLLQAKYWNSSVNEVEGAITDSKGKVIHKLFGKWHESVFCGDPPSATCIWRASMSSFFCENVYIFLCIAVSDAVDVCVLLCRCNASRPWAVLWFHQVCDRTERAATVVQAAATTHRHQTTCGPKVHEQYWKSWSAIKAVFCNVCCQDSLSQNNKNNRVQYDDVVK